MSPRLARRARREEVAGHLTPTHPKVLGHVRDDGPPSRTLRSCQPTCARATCWLESKRSPLSSGQVDPADEGEAIVDDDRLLVVAVQGTLVRVERAGDAGAVAQAVSHLPHHRSRRPEERQGGSRPGEHAHIDAGRELSEQVAQDQRVVAAREWEVGGEVPPGEVDVRRRRREFLGDVRKSFGAVDEHVQRAPVARGRSPSPTAPRRRERVVPAEPPEPPSMVGGDRSAHGLTELPVDAFCEPGRSR